jgi:hypothetical protein
LRELNVKEHSLILFAYIAVTSTQATAGLNAIRKYAPLYAADAAKVLKYAVGSIAAVVAALVFLGIGAELYFFRWLSEPHAQMFTVFGFVGCVGVGVFLVAEAERLVRVSNLTQSSI